MLKASVSALVAAAILAGCAAPPNTPGYGRGENYTPIVDMQGVDPTRYQADLNECRRYAGIIDRNADAWSGALAGVIVGGILAAALGGDSRTIDQSASLGGLAGMSRAENTSAATQQRVLINCMAGRGYKTLDGTVAPVIVQQNQSPYSSPQQPAQPTVANAPAAVELKERAVVGKDSFQAEQLAKQLTCAPLPVASLAAKGPGYESYSVKCSNGEALMIRCEFGNCRELK